MPLGQNLKAAFARFWESPALLSVMLLEFMLVVLLGILFFLGDAAIYGRLEPGAASPVSASTWWILGSIIVVQLLVLVYVDSFFKAGAYGMMKNTVQDGSTTFDEFLPSAKRYWYAMFRLLLIRYAITLAVAAPFLYTLLGVLSAAPGAISDQQLVTLLSTLAVAALLMAIIMFWLLYAEAAIAFDDLEAVPAIKASAKTANTHPGASVTAMLVYGAITMAGILAAVLLGLPLDLVAAATKSAGWAVAAEGVKFVLNIVTIAAGIIAMLFLFMTYRELRSGHKPAAPVKRKK